MVLRDTSRISASSDPSAAIAAPTRTTEGSWVQRTASASGAVAVARRGLYQAGHLAFNVWYLIDPGLRRLTFGGAR
jgi:hypothetical protein